MTERFLRAREGIAGNPREPRALYYLMMTHDDVTNRFGLGMG